MTQDFLDGPKVRPTVQQMRSRGVPEGVRAGCRNITQSLKEVFDHGPDLALVNTVASCAEEKGRTAVARAARSLRENHEDARHDYLAA